MQFNYFDYGTYLKIGANSAIFRGTLRRNILMSSHHFVKEGQEPALYIHEAISFSQVESLLEWAPLVITRSSQVERVINWGIKVDVVLIEKQDPVVDELLVSQFPVRTITVSESSSLVSAVRERLNSDHQPNITIACREGQSLLNDWRPANNETVTVIDTKHRWIAVGQHSFSKWLPAATRLLIFPEHITFRAEGAHHASNALTTIRDGVITIYSTEFFWVGEYL
jgi:hypothetical protein